MSKSTIYASPVRELPAGEYRFKEKEVAHEELATQMLFLSRQAVETFTIACGQSYNFRRLSDTALRKMLQPTIMVLSWLSDPFKAGSGGMTFSECCELLNLDTELVSDKMLDLCRKIPMHGQAAIHRYIQRLLLDVQFAKTHYGVSEGTT